MKSHSSKKRWNSKLDVHELSLFEVGRRDNEVTFFEKEVEF
jgi:hypothetical protein